jgi:hypothetical protein
MNPDVLRALQAVNESDRELQAPPEIEARLRIAFRRKKRLRTIRRVSSWGMAATILVAIVATYSRSPKPRMKAPVEQSSKTTPPAAIPATQASGAPVVRKAPARRAPGREIMTDFFPLMDVAPPIGRGALVRVDLPAEAMRAVGLPVREDRLTDRVQADVLLSEDGMATAIRFVRVSQ